MGWGIVQIVLSGMPCKNAAVGAAGAAAAVAAGGLMDYIAVTFVRCWGSYSAT